MSLKRYLMIAPLLLAACAQMPKQAAVEPPAQEATSPQQPTEQPLVLPKLELTDDMLYEFLLGDIASQRGNPELAAQIYMDLANATQDPRIVRRAAQLAFNTHETDKSIEALNLWLKLEPTSPQAKELLLRVLLSGGKLAQARPYLEEMLAAHPAQAGQTFIHIYALLLQHPDKKAIYKLLHELAQPYPSVAEAHLVQARAAAAAGMTENALTEVRQARSMLPANETAALLESQLLLHDSPRQALALLKTFLLGYPNSGQARLLYARMLLEQKQFAEARSQFLQLLDEHPANADLAFAVAMLSMQMGELDRAESELRLALVKGKKDESTVYYYLGQLNESQQHNEAALQNYRKVQDGENFYPARLRVAYLLYKQGKLEEARNSLRQTETEDSRQRVQLLSIEAQMLRDSKQAGTAYQVLTQGLKKLPDNTDLLYETGMLAEQLGKYDAFEQSMRKAIKIRPDYAQAYNALGYSLLDRNERVAEAMKLVEEANQLAPDDAGIIDSMGWGYYRMGNLDKSLEFLRRAFNTNPDPEIAAHLGEVLWMQGVKDEARQIWNDALKSHPDNPVLQATMKKFIP